MKTLPTGPSPLSAVAGVAFGVAGTGLGLVLGLVAVARRGKPLHPVGIVAPAVLSVSPGSVRSGSPLLDDAGEHSCLVRASYAMGTGPEHADIEGFALRVHPERAGVAVSDILFASTGTGAVGRHVLTLRRAGAHDVQTTLFPLHADGRALLLRLEPLDPGLPTVAHPLPVVLGARARKAGTSSQSSSWPGTVGDDAPERFDPVAHPLPGTAQYPVLAWLREPAYRLARLARPSAGRLP